MADPNLDLLPEINNEQDLLELIKDQILENFDTPIDETVQDNMYNHKYKALGMRENWYFLMEMMGKNVKRGQVQLSSTGNQTGLNPNYARKNSQLMYDKYGNLVPEEM